MAPVVTHWRDLVLIVRYENNIATMRRIAFFLIIIVCCQFNQCRSNEESNNKSGYSYLGCYKDSVGTGSFTKSYDSTGLDVSNCIDICIELEQSVAAVKNGKECWCSSDDVTDRPEEDTKCNVRCTLDVSKYCGGRSHFAIYALGKVNVREENQVSTTTTTTTTTSTAILESDSASTGILSTVREDSSSTDISSTDVGDDGTSTDATSTDGEESTPTDTTSTVGDESTSIGIISTVGEDGSSTSITRTDAIPSATEFFSVTSPSEQISNGDCQPFWVSYDGHCYLYEMGRTEIYDDAISVCASFGAKLVKIDDDNENKFITSLLNSMNVWIGLTMVAANEYGWVADGSIASYTNWNDGEPRNRMEMKCVRIALSGKWKNAMCDIVPLEFICETTT